MRMKRVLASLLAACCMFMMTAAAWAFVPQKISSLHPQFAQELSEFELDGNVISYDDLSSLEVYAGSELRIYLVGSNRETSLFFDQNGDSISTADVSVAKLRAAQLSVWAEDDTQMVDRVEFGYARKAGSRQTAAPYVRIVFTKQSQKLDSQPFNLQVGLKMGKNAVDGTELTLSGALGMREISATAAVDYLDVSDGSSVVAEENVERIALNLGHGLRLETSLKQGRKYYATVSPEEESSSGNVAAVYRLHAVGFQSGGTSARFDLDTLYYVYNDSGKYLGTTRQPLPFSQTYVLRIKKTENTAISTF